MARKAIGILWAELLRRFEEERDFDVDAFLREHPQEAPVLRGRFEKLRRAGLLRAPLPGKAALEDMRARFGPTNPVHASGTPGSRDNEDVLPSRVLGERYHIEAEIGKGGMGRVFRAMDIDLGRCVALKVINLEHEYAGDTPRFRALVGRFLAEAKVTAQLEHPAIVPLHDIGIDRTGQLYYTMKLVEGLTLDAWIRRSRAASGPLDVPEVIRIVLRLCEALSFAHARGVIHRDLKPSNVMIGRFGEVYVLDWGLVKLRGLPDADSAGRARMEPRRPRTRMDDVLGTPSHMAPEQARDPLNVDPRVDVYGVGAILYEAFAGRAPNLEGNKGQPRLKSRLGPEIAGILSNALAADPERRYPSIDALVEDLRAFLEARPGRGWRDGVARRVIKWARRNPASSVGVGAVFALVSMLTFVVLWRTRVQAELNAARSKEALLVSETERANAAQELVRLARLVALLDDEERQRKWIDDDEIQVAMPVHLSHSLMAFRNAEFPLDGATRVEDVLRGLERIGVSAPEIHRKVVEVIFVMAQDAERLQLPLVNLYCGGRLTRQPKTKGPLWTTWCNEYRALVDFMPRLDTIVDGLIVDTWRKDVYASFRARYRDLTPWPSELVEMEIGDPEDQIWFGLLLYREGDGRAAQRAVELLEAGVDAGSGAYWPHFLLGFHLSESPRTPEDLDRAVEYCYTAVTLNPWAAVAWLNWGVALMRTGRNVEAVPILERALSLAPDHPKILTNLCEALRRNGRPDDALSALGSIPEPAVPGASFFFNRALAYKDLGSTKLATQDLRDAIKQDARHAKAWAELGLILATSSPEEAVVALERALTLDPHIDEAAMKLAELQKRAK